MSYHGPRYFVFFNLMALLIMLSWLHPLLRPFWDQADNFVFFTFNGSLQWSENWGLLWALLNSRFADLIPLILLSPFILKTDVLFQRQEVRPALIGLFLLLILLLVFRVVVDIVAVSFQWTGDSPSRVLQPVILLSELFPGIDPKDASKISFPGDHASVLMTIGMYLLLKQVNLWSLFALGLVILLMLPRLFSGAHWLSDDLVGGGLIACMTMGFGVGTPFLSRLSRWLEVKTRSWVYFIVKIIPALKKYALFAETD